jgi:hypothetical protein
LAGLGFSVEARRFVFTSEGSLAAFDAAGFSFAGFDTTGLLLDGFGKTGFAFFAGAETTGFWTLLTIG